MNIESLRILRVRSANRVTSLPGITTYRNNRPCYGLMIKMQGETLYTAEKGESIISDDSHICLLPKGSSYSWKTTGGKCCGIEFDADIDLEYPLVFFAKENETVMRLFSNIEQVLSSDEDLSQMKAVSYLYQILIILLSKDRHYLPKKKEELISPGVNMMKSLYYRSDITVSDLAKASGISDAYFRRIYQEVYGTSPVKGLISLRMKKALELLQTDHNSVSAIAEVVGYTNPYHFSKAFKLYYGVAPSKLLIKQK